MASPVATAGGVSQRIHRGGARVDQKTSVATVAKPRHVTAGSSHTQRWSGCFLGTAQPACLPGPSFALVSARAVVKRWTRAGSMAGPYPPVASGATPPRGCVGPRGRHLVATSWMYPGGGFLLGDSVSRLPVISPLSQKTLGKWIQEKCSHPRKCTTAARGGLRGHPRVVSRPLASCSH